jgi:DNA primase
MSKVNLHKDKSLFDDNKSILPNQKTSSDIKFIRELLTEVDIVDILEDEYDLYFQESSGDWFNTNCPLPGHEDSSPSFGVNRSTGAFHCFGCGESGDLLAFIRKMEGLSFKQGLERLFMITGVDPEQENNDIYRTLRDLNSTVNDYINYKVEYDLPGGISPVQFLRSLTTRLKTFEKKIEGNEKGLEWVENIYEKADRSVMREDYKALNSLWKNIGKDMKNKLDELKEYQDD